MIFLGGEGDLANFTSVYILMTFIINELNGAKDLLVLLAMRVLRCS